MKSDSQLQRDIFDDDDWLKPMPLVTLTLGPSLVRHVTPSLTGLVHDAENVHNVTHAIRVPRVRSHHASPRHARHVGTAEKLTSDQSQLRDGTI